MTDLRKAAEMALEALESWQKTCLDCGRASDELGRATAPIQALRQALAQTEKPPVKSYCGGKPNYCTPDVDAVNMSQERVDETAKREHEPVAFYVYKPTLPHGNLGNVSDSDLPWVYDQDLSSGYSARMLVYTAPPKREWVGLTDDETDGLIHSATYMDETDLWHFVSLVEERLKEKNGG